MGFYDRDDYAQSREINIKEIKPSLSWRQRMVQMDKKIKEREKGKEVKKK